MGIRAKLILSTCIPLLLIYVAVLCWDYVKSRQQALQQIEQLVAQRASADASQVNARLTTIQQIVNRAAYDYSSRATIAGQPASPRSATTEGFGTPRFDGPPPDAPAEGATAPGGAAASASTRGGRGNFGGGFGGGGFGGGFNPALRESPWISAIWLHLEPSVSLPQRVINGSNQRRSNGDRRPYEEFHPGAAAAASIAERAKREGHPLWLDPGEAGDLGIGPSCVYAEPFFAQDDSRLLGVVAVAVPVDALRFLREDTPVQSQLRNLLGGVSTTRPTTAAANHDPISLAGGGYLLVDRGGKILSRPDGKVFGSKLAVGPDAEELHEAIDRSLQGYGSILLAGGLNETLGEAAPMARYVLAFEPLQSTGWLYVTAAPESDLLGPVQERLIKRAVFLSASLLVLVAVVSVVLTRFCRPIEQMADTVQELASGNLDIAPVPVTARDELGRLAKGFNDMTGRLRDHVRELTEQSAEREKVESELRIARQIQSDLLPRTFPPFPDRQEFSLHAVNIPARHIAGDFFDFFFTGDDRLIVVIADVSGKGVPAALMMAVTRTMVRNLAETGLTPCEIVERVNRMLVEDTTPGLFVTMVLGQYEPSTGRFTYVNAGHPPAVCVDGHASVLCCPATSPLLGVVCDGSLGGYEQHVFTLEPHAAILFYTDGVTEAHDQTNVMFGEGRLQACVERFGDRAAPDLCEGVVTTVMAYQHQNAADDLTLVCLRRTGDVVAT